MDPMNQHLVVALVLLTELYIYDHGGPSLRIRDCCGEIGST